MILRPATADDVSAVHALECALFGPDAWSADSVRSELVGERRRSVVAGGPEVVGYVVAAQGADVVDVQRIGVHPAHRRQGLAGRLLEAATRPDERTLLEVSAENAGALAFYARQGFAEIDRRRRYYRDGSDAVVLQRLPSELSEPTSAGARSASDTSGEG